jgi:hypothetical protein
MSPGAYYAAGKALQAAVKGFEIAGDYVTVPTAADALADPKSHGKHCGMEAAFRCHAHEPAWDALLSKWNPTPAERNDARKFVGGYWNLIKYVAAFLDARGSLSHAGLVWLARGGKWTGIGGGHGY